MGLRYDPSGVGRMSFFPCELSRPGFPNFIASFLFFPAIRTWKRRASDITSLRPLPAQTFWRLLRLVFFSSLSLPVSSSPFRDLFHEFWIYVHPDLLFSFFDSFTVSSRFCSTLFFYCPAIKFFRPSFPGLVLPKITTCFRYANSF